MCRQEERSTTKPQVLSHIRVDDDVNPTLHMELLPLEAPGICSGCPTILRKKEAPLPLAEGEGFEPPGLLTQLFSRQPQ